MLNLRQIKNSDVTEQGDMNAKNISGPDVQLLQRKPFRRSERHVDLTSLSISKDITDRNEEMVVCSTSCTSTIFHSLFSSVQLSNSAQQRLGTIEKLTRRSQALNQFKVTYAGRGFTVNFVAADNKYSTVESDLTRIGIRL